MLLSGTFDPSDATWTSGSAASASHALVHRQLLRLLDRLRLDRRVERENVIGLHACFDGIELAECANEETGRGEEDHADRELRDDERLLETMPSPPRGELRPAAASGAASELS